MTDKELVAQIQEGIDVTNNLEKLYLNNEKHICNIARSFKTRNDVDDLIQEGYIALHQAALTHDPLRGASFSTYAYILIRYHCRKYINSTKNIKITAYMNYEINKYRNFINKYFVKHRAEPSDEVIMIETGISNRRLQSIKKAMRIYCVSIFENRYVTDDGVIFDFLAGSYNVEDDAESCRLRKQIGNAVIALLNAEQKFVIYEKYWQEEKISDIAKRLSITYKKAKAIENTALTILREQEDLKLLYYDFCAYDFAYTFKPSYHTSVTEQLALKRVYIEDLIK